MFAMPPVSGAVMWSKHDIICYFWLLRTSSFCPVQVQRVLLKAASPVCCRSENLSNFSRHILECWCLSTSERAGQAGWVKHGRGARKGRDGGEDEQPGRGVTAKMEIKWRLPTHNRKKGWMKKYSLFWFLLLMLCCKHFLFYVQHTPKVHVCVLGYSRSNGLEWIAITTAIKTPHHAWCYCSDIISTKGALADTRARTYSTQRERRRQQELYSKGGKAAAVWGKEF